MPGVDFLQLNAADAPPGGIATWLTDALRAAIGDGRLTTGDREALVDEPLVGLDDDTARHP